jgi:hypothetical protein
MLRGQGNSVGRLICRQTFGSFYQEAQCRQIVFCELTSLGKAAKSVLLPCRTP